LCGNDHEKMDEVEKRCQTDTVTSLYH
jgi:hypothetical protein